MVRTFENEVVVVTIFATWDYLEAGVNSSPGLPNTAGRRSANLPQTDAGDVLYQTVA